MASLSTLYHDLDRCRLADRHRLRQRIKQLGLSRQNGDAEALAKLHAEIAASIDQVERRRAALPKPEYDLALPILERKAEILAAIAHHQVLIVCGETGSGKTTQLPKICLELERGVTGMIGCTQPRRIAARSVAARLAAELHTSIGHAVGYQVRFHDRVSEDSHIKIMTDGILLAETSADRWLERYDTLIIDEAHERSLNIDFLLGYVKRLLPKRPELKLIISSATLDAQRFAQHFGGAPVIEVSGRLYPVETRYRTYQSDGGPREAEDEGPSLRAQVLKAVDELCELSRAGDVLVFLPGEREIRECAEALRKHHPPHTEVLPLYARLSLPEQERIFKPASQRRIVLATNVAETSLTVPGIRYVVDSGLARINRYSARRKVSQLQIERIARASAIQRAGRCGRLANGVCIRLYSEEDFNARPEFTTPELLRTSLAAVILRMEAMRLGPVAQFPFVDAPSPKMIDAGYQLLLELGALDAQRRLSTIGRELARLPVDPRVGRMLLAAREFNCLTELLVIGAALCVQDPRERPLEQRAAALQRHAQFHDERSDFLSYLKLWAFAEDALRHKKSNRKFAQLCAENFLSVVRLREWRDVHTQLHALVSEMGMKLNTQPASYEQVHRALLSGLLGNIGAKDREDEGYQGGREARFVIARESALGKKRPRWVMGAELIETARLIARCVAGIEPEWIEAAAGELVRRTYFDPHWERKRAQVMAYERVSLYGLPVIAKRPVHFGPIDPKQAREIFIRSGLVAGQLDTGAKFLQHNLDLVRSVETMEHKVRRQDILVDDEVMYTFYDARVPADICNGAGFEDWRRAAESAQPRLLFMTKAMLIRPHAQWSNEEWYPEALAVAGDLLPLQYRFNPDHPLDGITVTLPLHLINQVAPAQFDWLVPGFLREKVTFLVKSLPQRLRRLFVPVKDTVTACLEALDARDEPLVGALCSYLSRRAGVTIQPEDMSAADMPVHLRMNFRIIDDAGNELAHGRDLSALRAQLTERAQSVLREQAPSYERTNLRRWDFGDLPATVEIQRGKQKTQAYPALVDCRDSVAIRLFDTESAARAALRAGLVRLLKLELSEQVRYLERQLPGLNQMCLRYAALPAQGESGTPLAMDIQGRSDQLKDELIGVAFARAFLSSGALPRSAAEFAACRALGRARLVSEAQVLARQTAETLELDAKIKDRLRARDIEVWSYAVDDVREQLAHLVYPGFISATPDEQLPQLPRYLNAVLTRLAKIVRAPQRDEAATVEIQSLWQNYRMRRNQNHHADSDERYAQARWMLEELRVSLFAQELKTAYPVSVKRAAKQLSALAQ